MNSNTNTFEVSQLILAPVSLYGIGVNTGHATAMQDCPALWKQFVQLLQLNKAPEGSFTNSYGVSAMTSDDPTKFYYFAGVETLPPSADIKDFTTFDLPGGLYAVCLVPSIQQLGEVFSFIYKGSWLPVDAEYQLDMRQPCIEFYTPAYMSDGSFYVYAPLKSK